MSQENIQEMIEGYLKEQVRSAFVRVEKLEWQLGYSTDFLPPIDPDNLDQQLAELAKRVTWLEQFSGERPCPRA